MEIDHIIPLSLGGPTEEEDLWLACSLCNDHKGEKIAGIDPKPVKLFGFSIPVSRIGMLVLPGLQTGS